MNVTPALRQVIRLCYSILGLRDTVRITGYSLSAVRRAMGLSRRYDPVKPAKGGRVVKVKKRTKRGRIKVIVQTPES